MKNYITTLLLFLTTMLNANFDFGECQGSGTFEQEIIYYAGYYENAATVGEIPAGIKGLKVSLTSDKDVDIRLYGDNADRIVHWPYGLLKKSGKETKPYQGVNVTYSGYNGVGVEKGHEYIEVNGTTPTTLTMKAFGYRAGYATVNYSWTGKEGCNASATGEGNFTQTLLKDTTSLVGTIPPHVNNLEINLTSTTDLDIQLYAQDGTAIASWQPTGLMAGAGKQSIMYHDMNITWSGYNGTDGHKGNEYITITGETSEMLIMKVFGYEAGEADVMYRWGDTMLENSINGTVKDMSGNALKDVKVYSASHTTYTNVNGHYILETNATENNVSVVVELENYIQNSQVVKMDTNRTQDFTMVYIDKIEIFDAEAGTEIKTKGAKIQFPPSSIVNNDGTAYIGDVTTKIAYNRVTTTAGKAAFPGDYIGETTEGNKTVLRSYGFIDVTIEDNASTPLKIADGSSVTLTFPMDESIEETPATIPLWYYDTKKGIWVEDGVATYDAGTNLYSGEVTHFTSWNLDAKMNPGSLEGCIEDSSGNPVYDGYVYLEGTGWGRGIHQNSDNTFKFLRAPTGIPLVFSAFTEEGSSQSESIILAPNEHRVMSDCLVIDNNTTGSFLHIKGRVVNNDGDIISNDINMEIYDTQTNTELLSKNLSDGIITGDIIRPASNKITVKLSINSSSGVSQTYLLDSHSNTLNMGDVVIDLVHIDGFIVNQDGLPVNINYNDIEILDVNTGESLVSSYYTDITGNIFTSANFIKPNNNMVKLIIHSGESVVENNITLIGSFTHVGRIVLPGHSIHGILLDMQGNSLKMGLIELSDPQKPTQILGYANILSDGTFTTTYFTPPTGNTLHLKITIGNTIVEKNITLAGSVIEDIGEIEIPVTRIHMHFTDMNDTAISVNRVEIYDTNGTYLGGGSSESDGSFSSSYIVFPDDGKITVRMIKNYSNNIYVERSFHVDSNTLDLGVIQLETVSIVGSLMYTDGTYMPDNLVVYTYNSDYNITPNTYNYDGGTYTSDSGKIDTGTFFRPGNNQVQIRIGLRGEDYIQTINLSNTYTTTVNVNIDAVVIEGTVTYANTGEVASNISLSNKDILDKTYDDYSYTNGVGYFTYGPILRPIDGNVTLAVYDFSGAIQGTHKGNTYSLTPDSYRTDLNNSFVLQTTDIKGCIDVSGVVGGFSKIKVNYEEPFVGYYEGVDGNISDNSFELSVWQSDESTPMYIYATDLNANKTTAQVSVIPNVALIDLTQNCQVLENEINTEKTVTVSEENYVNGNTIVIEYMKIKDDFGYKIMAQSEESLSFTTSKNGIYRISQQSDSYHDYGGTFTVIIDGVSHSITIPNTQGIYADQLIVFDIEIYQGQVKIIEVKRFPSEGDMPT